MYFIMNFHPLKEWKVISWTCAVFPPIVDDVTTLPAPAVAAFLVIIIAATIAPTITAPPTVIPTANPIVNADGVLG